MGFNGVRTTLLQYRHSAAPSTTTVKGSVTLTSQAAYCIQKAFGEPTFGDSATSVVIRSQRTHRSTSAPGVHEPRHRLLQHTWKRFARSHGRNSVCRRSFHCSACKSIKAMTGLSPVMELDTNFLIGCFLLPIDVEGEFRPPIDSHPQEFFAQVDDVPILFLPSCLALHDRKNRCDGPPCKSASVQCKQGCRRKQN